MNNRALNLLYTNDTSQPNGEYCLRSLFSASSDVQDELQTLRSENRLPVQYENLSDLQSLARQLMNDLKVSKTYLLSVYEFNKVSAALKHVDQLAEIFSTHGQVLEMPKGKSLLIRRIFRE